MNCNCTTELAEKLKQKLSENNPPNTKKGAIQSTQCQNVGINFKTSEIMLGIGFSVRFANQKKEEVVLMYADFCPFCGKPTAKTPTTEAK